MTCIVNITFTLKHNTKIMRTNNIDKGKCFC